MEEPHHDEDVDLPEAVECQLAALHARGSADHASEIEALCARHPAHAGRIRAVAAALADIDPGTESSPPRPVDPMPERIGPYRILERVGEGGMGTVYRGERSVPVRQIVAVKVVRAGFATREVLARFELERRALAAMTHPCIARVLDAGATDGGEPYFVMEYVEGLPIHRYCDVHRLSITARLELFQKVCHGVQHAHQKGVVHRDLKPANVLVAGEGDDASPKILDFGLAKATDRDLLEESPVTEQDRVLGTPEYMSPEQAAADGGMIDARADIYSLGVMLYELLAGELPFASQRLRSAGALGAMRILRDEDPPRPSSRLTSRAGLSTDVANTRRTTVQALARALKGDLDWVVMRAMAKEPERRYDSATSLAMDLRRYLAHEPVLAGPPGVGYRMRKFVRRYRVQTFAAAGVLLTMIAAGIGIAVFALQATRQAAIASINEIRASEGERIANERADEIGRQHAVIRQFVERLEGTLASEARARGVAEQREYGSRILAASAALRVGDAVAARSQLEQAPRALRGWEWRHIFAELDRSEHTLRGHVGAIRTLAFEPSGRWLASGGRDRRVIVWDAERWREITGWEGLPAEVVKLEAHRDGRRLLVLLERLSVAVRDVVAERTIFERALPGIACAAFQPGGGLVAVCAADGLVHLLDADTGTVGTVIDPRLGPLEHLAFDPSGRSVVVASAAGAVAVIDLATGAVAPVEVTLDSLPRSAAFLGGGHQFGILAGRSLCVVDAEAHAVRRILRLAGPRSWGFAASPGGDTLVFGGADGTVRLVDVTTGGEVARLPGHADLQVTAVAVRPDGSGVVSAGLDLSIKTWTWPGAEGASIEGAPAWIPGFAIDPDGTRIAESGGPSWNDPHRAPARLSMWSTDGALAWTRILDRSRQPEVLQFDPTGSLLAAGSIDGYVTVYGAQRGDIRLEIRAHPGAAMTGVAYSPRGDRIATSARESTIRLWDTGTGAPVGSFQLDEWAASLAWGPAGERLLVGLWTRSAVLIDVARGTRTVLDGHSGTVCSVTVSPDGRRAATGSWDRTVRIWDLADGRELVTLRGHSERVHAVAFSPGGERIATGSLDCTVKIWDPVSGRELATLHGHHARVHALGFSADGDRLFSKDIDGVIRVWDTEPDPRVRRLSGQTRRIAHELRVAAARADQLLLRHPAPVGELRRWLEGECPQLVGSLDLLRHELDGLGARARRGTPAPIDELLAAQPERRGRLLEELRSARGVRLGSRDLPVPDPGPELGRLSAAELYHHAWSRIGRDMPGLLRGEAPSALAAARLAVDLVDSGRDHSKRRCDVLDALAWANLANGADQAALDADGAALQAAPLGEKADFADHLRRLELAIAAAHTQGDAEIARVLDELASDGAPRFDDAADRARWEVLTELAAKIAAVRDATAATVRERLEVGERIVELSLHDPSARAAWDVARMAIRAADGRTASEAYRAATPIDVRPQAGLVPIGMNPVTKLWEFYDLASAADARRIPVHDPVSGAIPVDEDTGVVLVLVPGGTVWIGAQSTDPHGPNPDPLAGPDESPREVTIRPFFIARHELTQGQWRRLSGRDSPSCFRPGLHYPGDPAAVTLAHPVESVRWSEAVSVLDGHGLALPTEVQWEYAARAGSSEPWPFPDADSASFRSANLLDAGGAALRPLLAEGTMERDGWSRTAPVGSYPHNRFGLFDVHGNVAELCLAVQPTAGPGLPPGVGDPDPANGTASPVVARGGSWVSPLRAARVSARVRELPAPAAEWLGVRVVRALEPVGGAR
jgi:WD40 repeat protein/serine/threonine protein kinase/formylglycine-generating enzyme required for sulfatase activity